MSSVANNTNIIEQANVYINCKTDAIYYAENCCMVPKVGKSEVVKLYEPQKNIIQSFLDDHYLIILKSRQTGASYISQVLVSWILRFYPNSIIGIISRNGKEASSFVRKTKNILLDIPYDYIRPKKTDFVEDNMQSFTLKNNSRLISQAVSMINPEHVFRGESLTVLIVDEAAFINKINTAWTAVAPALSIAQRAAKAANIPYGNIILSTPNGVSGTGEWYYKRYNNAINNPSGLYKAHNIHWRQIDGLDDKWYAEQCEILDNDPKKIKQELELTFLRSDGSVFSDEVQLALGEKIKDTTSNNEHKIKIKEGGYLNIYKKINPNLFYFIGVDTASASSNDFSTIEVIEYLSEEQIAEYKFKLEPKMFARVIKHISKMFPKNIIIVENSGGYGLTVLNELEFDDNNIFNLYGEYKLAATTVNDSLKNIKRPKIINGLSTNTKTRPLIMEAMYNQVSKNTDKIHSEKLALELLSLTNVGGKIQAEGGFNDDLVMAFAFCHYVKKYRTDSYIDLLPEHYTIEELSDAAIDTLSTDDNLKKSQNLLVDLNNTSDPNVNIKDYELDRYVKETYFDQYNNTNTEKETEDKLVNTQEFYTWDIFKYD